jgi:serine O-acetyltransferase
LFPHYAQADICRPEQIAIRIDQLAAELESLLENLHESYPNSPRGISEAFVDELPKVVQSLNLDARAIYLGDPAASSIDEVILSYPGFYAIAMFRVANVLYRIEAPLLPRLLTELAHRETGIDIHPGATIGRSFFIDHGTGVVIGETSHIGNNVKIYQGVTLGALVVEKGLASRKRHPTIEDNVVIYANATILGGETVIGHDSVVGGNAWITDRIPPFSVVGRHDDVRQRRSGADPELEFNI